MSIIPKAVTVTKTVTCIVDEVDDLTLTDHLPTDLIVVFACIETKIGIWSILMMNLGSLVQPVTLGCMDLMKTTVLPSTSDGHCCNSCVLNCIAKWCATRNLRIHWSLALLLLARKDPCSLLALIFTICVETANPDS